MCISVEKEGLFHSILCEVDDYLNVQQLVCLAHGHERLIMAILFYFTHILTKAETASIGLLS